MKAALFATMAAAICATTAARADIFDQAASAYVAMPAGLLRCIAHVESRNRLNAIGTNANGSEDLCAMQINSQWLPRLAGFGITRDHLLKSERVCVHTGAWILAHEVQAVGLTWRAVARYHTGPNPAAEDRGRAYASKVLACLNGEPK